jgi:Domain of unknown function (DUF4333)
MPSLSSLSASSAVAPAAVSQAGKSAETQKLETRLQKEITAKSGIAVQSIACPATIDTIQTQQFECQAIAEGKPFNVAISPKMSKTATADKSELQWNTKGLLVLPKLEQTIQQGIKQQFQIDVKTSCGGKVRIAKPGDTFECKVTDQRGQTKAVQVRVDNEKGGVTWKL